MQDRPLRSVSIGISAMIKVDRVTHIGWKHVCWKPKIFCSTAAKIIDPNRIRRHLMATTIVIPDLETHRFLRASGVLYGPGYIRSVGRMQQLRVQYFDRLRP